MESGNFGHKKDLSYYKKYPYYVRKLISLWRHTKDDVRHFSIFPLDSMKVWGRMLGRGISVAIKGK